MGSTQADDDVALDLDVDAVRVEVRRHDQALAVAAHDADAAPRTSREHICVADIEPDERATDGRGPRERSAQLVGILRELRVHDDIIPLSDAARPGARSPLLRAERAAVMMAA
jgi:hypothetical protein